MFDRLHHGQELSASDTVLPLCMCQGTTVVGDDFLYAILFLWEYRPNAIQTSVGIQGEESIYKWISENRWGCQSCLQWVECLLAFRSPFETGVLFCEPVEGSCQFRKVLHESPVVWTQPNEAANLLHCLWFWPGWNSLDFLGIRLHSPIWHNMSQKFHSWAKEFAFVRCKLQIGSTQSLQNLCQSVHMLIECLGEYNYIVNINQTSFPVKTSENSLHQAFKCGWGIC